MNLKRFKNVACDQLKGEVVRKNEARSLLTSPLKRNFFAPILDQKQGRTNQTP